MQAYFCDPQAPWQKGAVECNNNRIRRFLPREVDLKTVSDADIYAISVIMNSTPRRCLNGTVYPQTRKTSISKGDQNVSILITLTPEPRLDNTYIEVKKH